MMKNLMPIIAQVAISGLRTSVMTLNATFAFLDQINHQKRKVEMPTYDYKCPKCKTMKELVHSIIDTPRISCEKCEVTMTRLIGGGTAVHFKGSGFWETDYNKKRTI